ncbi:neprilysin-1-like [Chelonus insularis]|uniref:neprilysin-1-like n=1 Tax=Chelonus insularis TaxID=460826 RepID=UPI00158F5121|nr:neprilysin-1-like [Chelonus insularis]
MKYQISIVLLLLADSVFTKHIKPWNENHKPKWITDNEVVDNDDEEINVCQTDECKILGREFLKGMNKSVNPCDNFYEFMCGEYKNNYKIPGYMSFWNRPLMFQHTVYRRIKAILEVEPEKSDILPVRLAKKWYQSCMDTDTLEKRGIKPLESILMQLGGWPMTIDVEEWDENGHSWQRIEQHYFHLTGSHIFFDIKPVMVDDKLIMIRARNLPLFDKLPSEYRKYSSNKYDEYVKLIKKIVQIFIEHNKADVFKSALSLDVENLVAFEKQLEKIFRDDHSPDEWQSIEEFIVEYENAVNATMEESTIKINFRKLIKNEFDLINSEVNNLVSVMTHKIKYLIKLTDLLNKTPKRTIVNYLHWYFVSDMLAYTTKEVRDVFFEFMENELGLTETQPRWLECANEMKMSGAAGYAFVKKYFSPDAERTARRMVENIRAEMKSQISAATWLDEETKDLVIDKLQSMEVLLGFPEWYKNKTRVINYYKGLIIGYDYFDNVLSYKKYSVKQSWHNAMIDGKDREYSFDPLVTNALYRFSRNNIELPAADFQPPLFTSELPSVVNYGSIGSIIGHEIGHGFDVKGITYGKDGKRAKITKTILKLYYEHAYCFIEQFQNYYEAAKADAEETIRKDFSRIKAAMTYAENVADTTGLHAVVKAYQNLRAKNPDIISKLPGLEEYTDDQLFFISFGALWCQIETPQMKELSEKNDSHSPMQLRSIGALANSEDFARAFNCPRGSPMNPENKCNIWNPENSTNLNEKIHHQWLGY